MKLPTKAKFVDDQLKLAFEKLGESKTEEFVNRKLIEKHINKIILLIRYTY